jgi:hypothetical protein
MYCKAGLAVAVALSSLFVSAADEGWRNVCATRKLPSPVKGIWSAPIDKGAEAFSVEWRDGATGTVSFARTERGHCIRIAKTTPAGYVLVSAKDSFAVPPGAKLRAYAGCESGNADCEYSYGFLRLYGKDENLSFFGMGAYGIGGPKMNRIANTPQGMPDRKLCHRVADQKTGTNITAAIVVAGAPSTSVWTHWGVEDFAASSKAWNAAVRARKPPAGADRVPVMTDAEFDACIAKESDHTAKVVSIDGCSRLLLDGKQVVPVFFKGSTKGFYGGAKMSAIGMDLQSTDIRLGVTKKNQEHGFWSKDGFDVKGAVAAIRKSMMRAPNAKYLLGINLSAYPEFSDEHPDEVWVNDKGRKVFGHNCHSSYSLPKKMDPNRHWYWISNHSLVWRDAVNEQLTKLIDELKRTGLSRLIVGVHLSGYHDAQFATVHPDYSKPAIEGFRRWLKKKYPTESTLRRAWNDESVTYATATPPRLNDRFGFHNYLKPVAEQAVIDYSAYLQKGPFFIQEDFARHVKKCFGKDIVVVRYCMSAFGGSWNGAYDITPFAKSDAIDIICAQPSYGRRVPGLPFSVRLPVASFHKNGKLFFNEFDLRTYGALTAWETEQATLSYSRATDDPMWCAINRKLAGQMYALRMGWWYLDMAGGWFEPDGIAADIGDTVSVGRRMGALRPSKWRPDVAIVIDEDGAMLRNILFHYYNSDESCLLAEQMQVLAAGGVPSDTWLMQDWLENPSLADRYRTIVFFGMYDIDDRRAALVNRLRTKGRTLVFQAGTGAARGVERIGFRLGQKSFPAQHETAAEPNVKWNMNSLLHASKITELLGVSKGWPWQYRSPTRLYIEPSPELKSMARFTEDGTIAVAERSDAAAKLVYVAAYGGFTPDYYHHLAMESGAYVPADGYGLEIDMNGDFMSVHCLKAGVYDIRLPFVANVINLKTGAMVASSVKAVKMELEACETRWYQLIPSHNLR